MSNQYLSVTALTKYIKRKIDMDPHLNKLWLKGEISNFKHHSRGHMYLTIKDDQTRIQAVMFAGSNKKLKFVPENGMNVLIKGNISVFESFGQYQLYIDDMEPDGIGALYLAYEQLKQKLEKQGLFDIKHKKQLPPFPTHIGIITSPTGAAVRDVITTLERRYPIAKKTVIPALVQGEQAAQSIVNAIEIANASDMFDVLIVGRGGGSIEELWAFNEEIVAKAIYNSKIPIVSAVGHETDQTISDFVADLRAPTPTGAAELVAPSQTELKTIIVNVKRSLTRSLRTMIDSNKKQISYIKQSYAFRYPENLIKQKEQELDRESQQLNQLFISILKFKNAKKNYLFKRLQQQNIESKHMQAATSLNQLNKRQQFTIIQLVDIKKMKLKVEIEKLILLNPLEILKRGFALPYTNKKDLITTTNQVKEKDKITVKISDGEMLCSVLDVKENHDE